MTIDLPAVKCTGACTRTAPPLCNGVLVAGALALVMVGVGLMAATVSLTGVS
ncbi:MAG: hypothetical protein ACOYB2_17680 [Limnohabitans sp.]